MTCRNPVYQDVQILTDAAKRCRGFSELLNLALNFCACSWNTCSPIMVLCISNVHQSSRKNSTISYILFLFQSILLLSKHFYHKLMDRLFSLQYLLLKRVSPASLISELSTEVGFILEDLFLLFHAVLEKMVNRNKLLKTKEWWSVSEGFSP